MKRASMNGAVNTLIPKVVMEADLANGCEVIIHNLTTVLVMVVLCELAPLGGGSTIEETY